ncbi:MAG: acyl-CoA thioesterase [Clostridiales Family XIII bacterium]|jgi:acyl-CoA thioester hydrolase|nr:acyl-CoA thioesterase [Clostridiales Family XIII bacterium]
MKKFFTEYRVIYADVDAMGVVYHSNYIDLFERGRAEFLRQIGYPYSELETIPVWLPCVAAHCVYKSPAKYDDLLEIASWPAKLAFATIRMEYEIRRKETGELLVAGYTEHAFTDDKLKPVKAKRVIPELYGLVKQITEENTA